MANFTQRILASTDDAEQQVTSTFGMDLASSDLELHDTGTTDGYVGMRWDNVTIPAGSTIDDAKIQFHVDEIVAASAVALTVTFRGEDIDDAPTFTATASDISNRVETTATVNWAIPTWVSVHDEGAAQLSADLAPIVQEIIDRGGWNSGQAIVIMIKAWSGSGERTAESFDAVDPGLGDAAPQLIINFTPPGPEIQTISQGNTSGTTHSITLPSGITTGDQVVVFFGYTATGSTGSGATDAVNAVPDATSLTNGWLKAGATPWGSLLWPITSPPPHLEDGLGVYTFYATGGSTTLTLETELNSVASSQTGRFIAYRISGGDTFLDHGGTNRGGNAPTFALSVPNPTSTPLGSATANMRVQDGAYSTVDLNSPNDVLVLQVTVCDAQTMTGAPSGYADLITQGTGTVLHTCHKNIDEANTTEDPGVYTGNITRWACDIVTLLADPAVGAPSEFATTVAATSTVSGEFRSITPAFVTTISPAATITASLKTSHPFITDSATTVLSSRTSHSIVLPTHKTGDLLYVMFAAIDTTISIDVDVASSLGWKKYDTALADEFAGTVISTTIFFNDADSASETLTVSTENSVASSAISYAIEGATDFEVTFDDSPATAISPSLDMQRSGFYLTIASSALDNNPGVPSAAPSGYSGFITTAAASRLSSAFKFVGGSVIPAASWGSNTTPDNSLGITASFYSSNRFKRLRYEWPVIASTDQPDFQGWTFNVTSGGQTQRSNINQLDRTTGIEAFINSGSDEEGFFEIVVTPTTDLGLTAQDKILSYENISIDRQLAVLGTGSAALADAGGTHAVQIIDTVTRNIIPNDTAETGIGTWARLTGSDVTGLLQDSSQTITFRIHVDLARTTSTALARIDNFQVDLAITRERLLSTTIDSTSTVAATLIVDRPLITAIPATSTVTGNIDETRKLMGTTVVESALVVAAFNRQPAFISTTNVVSTVTAGEFHDASRELATTVAATSALTTNLGLTVFFNSDTNAVSVVSPNQFFFGFEAVVSATSTVGATLDVARDMVTPITVASTVNPNNMLRDVDWNSTISIASAVFPSTFERDVSFIADVNASNSVEGAITLAGRFEAVITAQSALDTTELERTRGYNTTINVVSDVGGNIVEGLRFVSATVSQSAVVLPTNLEVARDMIAIIPATSTVASPQFLRDIEWATVITDVSALTVSLVVITNTLELTFSETSFVEISDRVLQLVTVNTDSVHIINELDTVTPVFVELGDDIVITDTTDN